MSENTWFYSGLAVLAVAAYVVPGQMGLGRGEAFFVGLIASSVWVCSFRVVADRIAARDEDEDEEGE